jgi:GPH family glycoside/pentoside/hexuronide:cation symporter
MDAPKLGFSPKFWFGVGQSAEGIKNVGFGTFLLIYYSQILGLNPALAGAVLLISLAVDAVSDPVAGSLSDGWRGRFGRRHGFMYAAALPMAVTFYFVWAPPAGLGQTGLFLWMLGSTLLARAAMTLYHVPHLALGAELSEDYAERTRVVAFRTFFGFLGAASLILAARFVFMAPTPEYPNGQLDPSGYPAMGLFAGITMGTVIFLSAFGTHSRIPYLPQPKAGDRGFSLQRVMDDLRSALRNPSFRPFFGGVFLFFVARGVDGGLGLYMGTFFWKLGSNALALPLAGLLGILFGTPLFALLSNRIERKPMFMGGIIGFPSRAAPRWGLT